MKSTQANDILEHSRILIVDDEPANIRLLERTLQSAGLNQVRSTSDSRETLALLEDFSPDLILLDLMMPNVDGFAVMEAVRERLGPSEYLPILVLTADTTRPARERALSCGATDFLLKPIERVEALLRIRNLLQSRRLHLAIVNENQTLETKLAYQTFHDPLTGLANRVLFRDRIEHALDRAARGALSVLLLLDLDDFKTVNDEMGHGEGDRLLLTVAVRLKQITRGCDTVSRLGGDEFGILLDDVDSPTRASQVVDRILEVLRLPIPLEGREFTIGASIGVAEARPQLSVEELLRNAEVAMYQAKSAGKGRAAVFDSQIYDVPDAG